ncbi:unnamed protein product [Sphenostylis stenocarpa]|uniref:Oberon-like PHD finger domain-containing protein n=1 Tax=Sphenostylis stenocarpa TaxID=92480 RepID=A0AA86SZU0_9FABA|nr:unnamed protein product [Sphenostylis stenocarpa]
MLCVHGSKAFVHHASTQPICKHFERDRTTCLDQRMKESSSGLFFSDASYILWSNVIFRLKSTYAAIARHFMCAFTIPWLLSTMLLQVHIKVLIIPHEVLPLPTPAIPLLQIAQEPYNSNGKRCKANNDKCPMPTESLSGHVCHIECSLRSFLDVRVGGNIGLDGEYHCRRCSGTTDMISHVYNLLQTCKTTNLDQEILKKILNLGAFLVRGSGRKVANELLAQIDRATLFRQLKRDRKPMQMQVVKPNLPASGPVPGSESSCGQFSKHHPFPARPVFRCVYLFPLLPVALTVNQ